MQLQKWTVVNRQWFAKSSRPTRLYQEGHELPYESVEVQFTKEVIGGDFG